jgi:type I restriction enzyme, R subunit
VIQQFRAVHAGIQHLKNGKTRLEDGEHDRRGGIVWHTQGSGKSLTMVFLVRKMRSDSELRRFKVVVVTDRKPLQKQLSETAELAGEPVKVGKSIKAVKKLLKVRGPGLVFAMIQKYGDPESKKPRKLESSAPPFLMAAEPIAKYESIEQWEELNDDDSIVVLVDEAHRSHTNTLHANLMTALPNAARIGFTGTPIIMGAKQRTHEIFGEYIDRYTIKQSEEDGATVPILYEGRTTSGAIKDGASLNGLFVDMFADRTPEELEAIKKRYATKGHVMEAEQLIEAKARDMLRHYVANILPNGFKAQVVAVSRRATVRYYHAFKAAQAELVAELESLSGELLSLDPAKVDELSVERRFLVRAHRHLDLIRELELAPVISAGTTPEDALWVEWTDEAKIDVRIERFKKKLVHEDPAKRDPLAFLIVKNMLLTGFDAPIEQVMYLDRQMKEAALLQAIARVNRTYDQKQAGIVVDYYGVASHLKEALAAYSPEDIEGSLKSLKDEIPKLRDRHHRVVSLFTDRGIDDLHDTEECVYLLRDEKLRAEFTVKLKQFLSTLDTVLPRPEGLPYVADSKTLGFILKRANNRYRDEALNIAGVGNKVRELIDEHVISMGIDPKIPPVSIMDADFEGHLDRQASDRAKASEMEHAARYHIRKHFDEDPAFFQNLSEHLEEILKRLKDNWEQLVIELDDVVQAVRKGRQRDDTGLAPETQAPFLGVIVAALGGESKVKAEKKAAMVEHVVHLVDHIQQEIRLVGFWQNAHAQQVLRHWAVQFLDEHEIIDFEHLAEVADRIVELAKVNHHKLVR